MTGQAYGGIRVIVRGALVRSFHLANEIQRRLERVKNIVNLVIPAAPYLFIEAIYDVFVAELLKGSF